MRPLARLLTLVAAAIGVAGCGPSIPPPGEATPVGDDEGVFIQEEWPDEVKEAEAKFQESAQGKAD
ncbi:hypothetical protein [Tautonia plasticadhaerens]|nr:hypothetical protein [Tautonia plasticadhaerens]